MDFSNNDKELMQLFQTESEDIIERIFTGLFSLEKQPANAEIIATLYRDLHSLKGAVRMIGFNNIQLLIHKMEDIFDAVNSKRCKLELNVINLISRSLEITSKYIQDSIRNNREIIDDDFKSTLSNLEYVIDVELADNSAPPAQAGIPGLDIPGFDFSDINTNAENNIEIDSILNSSIASDDMTSHQAEINNCFNTSFEIIDGIVPEEESTDIVLLKEEVQKIYDFYKNSNVYEIKASLENVITKIDFVMNATNKLTISEILELRNELSSAAAKFTTSCIDVETNELSFFDVAEKLSMLQGSSVYTNEIKSDILQLKDGIDDASILEIINTIVNILDFIMENSVQLEDS